MLILTQTGSRVEGTMAGPLPSPTSAPVPVSGKIEGQILTLEGSLSQRLGNCEDPSRRCDTWEFQVTDWAATVNSGQRVDGQFTWTFIQRTPRGTFTFRRECKARDLTRVDGWPEISTP